MAIATLGGGCFWCLEASFSKLKGVKQVLSGYAEGDIENPNYEQVCTGRSGHAEVVQISYDSDVISFDTLLQVFFSIHDPTTLNRQGADSGTQYRSIILYHNEEQLALARDYIQQLETAATWPNPIVTEVKPLTVFYQAEKYHQNYFQLNPGNGYCQAVIAPKVNKLTMHYPSLLKGQMD